MKKIMFSERYGLESAVLAGSKDMTRRVIKGCYKDVQKYHANGGWHFIAETEDGDTVELKPHFEIGERVAIAQRYKDLWAEYLDDMDNPIYKEFVENFSSNLFSAGHDNKMFVRADLMPHQIRITDLWFERLQAISDDDCLKEGVHVCKDGGYWLKGPSRQFGGVIFNTPREAFAVLIDKVSGPNTWHTNPWVIAYTFELVK